MIFYVDAAGRYSLLETDNLRQFHVEIDQPRPRQADGVLQEDSDIRIESPDVAWVSVARMEMMAPLAGRDGGRSELHRMVEKARPHGWVSADGAAVRAHIVWKRES